MGYIVGFIVALFAVLFTSIWRLCKILVWRPYAVAKFFEKQGIKGVPYSFLYGSLKQMKKLQAEATALVLDTNSNDIIPTVFPHYHKWSKDYGENMLYWNGVDPRITITDPEMAKQILSNKFGFYKRSRSHPSSKKLMGEKGVIFVEGEEWVRHRRILNPAFSLDKLKMMKTKIAECTISLLREWEKQALKAGKESIQIEMNGEFIKLTSDVIAHSAFGSSYVEAQEAFQAQKELQKWIVASSTDILIPGWQYVPTPSNIRTWKLDRKLRNKLRSIVETRISQVSKSCHYGDDLLGVMIQSSEVTGQDKVSPKFMINEIIENCKAFFFAGHETTANFLTWTFFILSLHQEWQQKLREEVLSECGMEIPDSDMLSKLKLVNMVLLEVLRLYNPVIRLFRTPMEDIKLGKLIIPKGTSLEISIHQVHRKKEYWGNDANNFNPMRFANGISKAAKHPNAFIPFSVGPRNCIGQTFALLEAKMVVSLFLQRFSFSLSPRYKHAPINYITLHPRYGMPILIKPLSH
ncbi:cytochrome P450 709B1-like [Euphorbia lathyris]|uniref:cytochrome P450 709B1-like n=1 Tax=Euphorbia lathyris TaxID=212925 RepID=UPI0033136CD4